MLAGGRADRDSHERSLSSERPDGRGGPSLASAGDPGQRALAPGSHLGATPSFGRHRVRSAEQRYDRAATVETRRACSRPAPTAHGAVPASPWRSTREPAVGEREGGWRRPFACVRALLRAQSEAHPRCDARHAKSAKQVRAPMRLQPSTVADSASCEIGEQEVCGHARVDTRFRSRAVIGATMSWPHVSATRSEPATARLMLSCLRHPRVWLAQDASSKAVKRPLRARCAGRKHVCRRLRTQRWRRVHVRMPKPAVNPHVVSELVCGEQSSAVEAFAVAVRRSLGARPRLRVGAG